MVFSYAMFRDLQKTQTVFTDIAAHVGFGANLASDAQTSSGEGLLVSAAIFRCWNCSRRLDDCSIRMTTNSSASRALWCSATTIGRRDGLDPTILNKQVIVNGQSLTIVGVAPKGFDGTTIGMRPAVFVPITLRSVLDAATVGRSGPTIGRTVRAPAAGGHNRSRARVTRHAVSRHHQ